MSDFGIELDDDLLAAALEAVEKVEKKGKSARAGAAQAEAEDGPAFEVELGDPSEGDDGTDGLDIDLEVDLDALAEDAASALDPGPAVDDGRVEALEEALAQARAELEATRRRARALDQELGRLKGSVRRLQEQSSRAETQATQAREARKLADEQRRAMRDRNHELKQELEHLRERRRRERDEDRSYGHQRTVEVFLPVLDNLELALEHQGGDAARVVQGVQMILQQFHQGLAQIGVQRVVSGEGVLFDPEVHEAISEVLTDELLPGSIVAELRPGYSFNGRLLRASRVTVAAPTVAAPAEAPEPPPTDTAHRADDAAPAADDAGPAGDGAQAPADARSASDDATDPTEPAPHDLDGDSVPPEPTD